MATKKIITLGNLTTFKSQCDSTYVALTGNQTISGLKYFSGNGLKVTGRVAGGGDDEGIVVEPASNSYAGVCCGSPSSRRAVFYLRPTDSCWRYFNGSANYDIVHPAKSGTIALTDDLSSYLPLSGGTMSGDIDFSTSSSWIKPYLLAFKNADTNSSPTYPYTGFYQWGNEWQVNARDSNNSWAHNLLTINLDTKVATFTGSLISGGNLYFGSSTSSSNYISTEDGGSRLGLHGISGIKSFNHIIPSTTESYDLGDYATTGGAVTSNKRWRNLYLSGNLSDGTNSISIANIVSGINSIPTSVVTSATLNGSSTTSPSWYAPTSAISTTTSKRYLLGSSSSTSIATTNTNASCYMQSGYLYSNSTKVDMSAKQDTLVSGTNIKTVNNNSLLGSGNISVNKSYMHQITLTTTGSATTVYLTVCCSMSSAITSSGTFYNSGYHRMVTSCTVVNSTGNYYPAKFDAMTSNTSCRLYVSGQKTYWTLTVSSMADTVYTMS